MDEKRLEEIRKRVEKTPEGPWVYGQRGTHIVAYREVESEDSITGRETESFQIALIEPPSVELARFMAHARKDTPDLIAALEEARREVERLREACLLANEALNALCLHPTNEVPEGFFAAWSRATDGEGIGYRAHSAVHWAAIHPNT